MKTYLPMKRHSNLIKCYSDQDSLKKTEARGNFKGF